MKQTRTVRISVGQVTGKLTVKNLLLRLWSLSAQTSAELGGGGMEEMSQQAGLP